MHEMSQELATTGSDSLVILLIAGTLLLGAAAALIVAIARRRQRIARGPLDSPEQTSDSRAPQL